MIEQSVRGLSTADYSSEQIDAAMTYVFGVDTQLIADGTYYVIDGPDGPVACGGWSYRQTLYGGDQTKTAPDGTLDPRTDAARIRAYFVHPDWTRRGLASLLFHTCARAAFDSGFRQFELMATLPGVPLYAALGFAEQERVTDTLANGIPVPFVRMTRMLEHSDEH